MKAIEALKQINEIFPEYIAIAKDSDNEVHVYTSEILEISNDDNCWQLGNLYANYKKVSEKFASKIEWELYDWTKCIVTLNDIQNES